MIIEQQLELSNLVPIAIFLSKSTRFTKDIIWIKREEGFKMNIGKYVFPQGFLTKVVKKMRKKVICNINVTKM